MVTHQEVVLGVKGNTEDRRLVAPESFLPAAVRHLHHLHQEVTEQSRAEQSGGNEKEKGAEMQHECRNHQINGSNRPDFLHQTAARQHGVPSPTASGVSLLSQSIPSDFNHAENSSGDEPSRSECLIVLRLFGTDRLWWPAGVALQSRPIHKDNKDCRCLRGDTTTSRTMTTTAKPRQRKGWPSSIDWNRE